MSTDISIERRNMIALAVQTTVSLRESCRACGVPGLSDFLNGLLNAGSVLHVSVPGEGSFVKVLDEEIAGYRDVLQSRSLAEHGGKIGGHSMGEVLADKSSQSMIVSVACEETLQKVAKGLRLNKEQMLRLAAIGVVASVVDLAEEDCIEDQLSVVLWSAMTRIEAGDLIAEMSDEEMFGDIED